MLKDIFNGLIDILYPKRCLVCSGRIDYLLFENLVCQDCFARLEKNTPPFCLKCGHNLKEKQIYAGLCKDCHRRQYAFKRNWSVCYYDGALKELIHLFKYKNKPKLAKILAQPLVGFIKEHNIPIEKFDYCIPIPLHPLRLREREFNQAELLLDELARHLPITIMKGRLKKIKQTRPQVDLDQEERFENMRSAFAWEDGQMIKDKTLLLLDDLFTTGSTVSEAAATLINAGAKEVCVLTLATPK